MSMTSYDAYLVPMRPASYIIYLFVTFRFRGQYSASVHMTSNTIEHYKAARYNASEGSIIHFKTDNTQSLSHPAWSSSILYSLPTTSHSILNCHSTHTPSLHLQCPRPYRFHPNSSTPRENSIRLNSCKLYLERLQLTSDCFRQPSVSAIKWVLLILWLAFTVASVAN